MSSLHLPAPRNLSSLHLRHPVPQILYHTVSPQPPRNPQSPLADPKYPCTVVSPSQANKTESQPIISNFGPNGPLALLLCTLLPRSLNPRALDPPCPPHPHSPHPPVPPLPARAPPALETQHHHWHPSSGAKLLGINLPTPQPIRNFPG
jgi:hypothetical protein